MPRQKRLPLGLISLPNLNILIDPEANCFMVLTEAEAAMWMDAIRQSGRLRKQMDDCFRRAHELGVFSDQRLQEVLNEKKDLPKVTVQQYEEMRFGRAGDQSTPQPFVKIRKLRLN